MCGIAGIMNLHGKGFEYQELAIMAETLSHRGPDGEGFALLSEKFQECRFCSAYELANQKGGAYCGFAHRRLAIIDLSDDGIQPMSYGDGRLWITFNGEIFNYIELRNELETLGRHFCTATDTEVLIQAYEEWGIDCLHKFNGMWAFAIWDLHKQRLFISRDRFGIKPLYYVKCNDKFAFASEPKALLKLPWVKKIPYEKAIADYLVHSREDCFRWTFFEGIKQIEPGHFLLIPFEATEVPDQKRWWNIENTLPPGGLSDNEAAEIFHELFESSVRLRLRSDVPVGTCLSGGLDSSAVVCAARPWLSPENQKSYSAVYNSTFELDETTFIDEIIKNTGIKNFRVYPDSEGLIEDIEQLIYYQDEPFGSTSQYAQYKVFQLARETGTTVTLDGQGADEELAGYHYFFPVHFAGYLRRLRFVKFISEFNAYRNNTGAELSTSMFSTMAGLLSHRSMIRLANRYDKGRGIGWVNPRIVQNARSIEAPQVHEFGDWLNRRLYEIFSVSGLPALLRYEDRNSMACSIEARLPFMDHRLVSFIFSLPANQKIREGMTKHVMRAALKGIVPERIRTRTDKIGFATPENRWFGRKPMLSYIKQIMNSRKTRNRGLIDCDKFSELLNANMEGRINGGRAIWRAVNIELWFRKFID